MKLVIFTGNELRHQYLVCRLAEKLPLAGIVWEEKANAHNKQVFAEEFEDLVTKHFANRAVSEHGYFAEVVEDLKHTITEIPQLRIASGSVNEPHVIEWAKGTGAEAAFLYGSGIVGPEIISLFPRGVINNHLGLSPYYRGSGTNFWPLVNNEPELVGGTIHLATAKVDAGAILHQYRPDVAKDDGPHDLGNKTIRKAADVIPFVVRSYLNGVISTHAQDLSRGRVYRRRDFDGEAVAKLYENFNEGMLENYLSEQEKRTAAFPIINQIK